MTLRAGRRDTFADGHDRAVFDVHVAALHVAKRGVHRQHVRVANHEIRRRHTASTRLRESCRALPPAHRAPAPNRELRVGSRTLVGYRVFKNAFMKSSTKTVACVRDLLRRRLCAHGALPLERDPPGHEPGEILAQLLHIEVALVVVRLEHLLEHGVRPARADLVVVLANVRGACGLFEDQAAQCERAFRGDQRQRGLHDHDESRAQVERLQDRIEVIERAPVFDELAADDCFEQLLLAAEVAVDRLLRDARAARHGVDARALVAVLEEVCRRDVEHFLLFRLRPCGALG